MEKAPPTVRRWGRVPPPRAGFRVPWFPSGVPRAAEHGNGRHHAKGRRTDPPQGERCRPFPVPMPGVEPGAVLPKVVKGDFKEPDGPTRKGKGWPTGSDLIGSGLPPRSGFHGAREGVPAACPCRVSNPVPSFRTKEISRSRTAPPWVMGLGWRPRGGAGRRGGMNPVATWVRAAVSPCRRSAGPSPRVGGTRSAGPRRRPRRAQPARPRRCSRRSRRAARGRHHPTTGRTGWHRR